MQLSTNFRLGEFTRSDTAKRLGIENECSSVEQVLNLAYLCHMVLQPLRDRFGPIRITSGYRCPELNRAVGGVKNSQHMRGEAADIHLPSVEKGKEYLAFLKTLPAVDDQEEWLDKMLLRGAIESLSERDKRIIVLRYFRDMTQSEVAERIGVSQVQVSRIESRIIKEFREKLSVSS